MSRSSLFVLMILFTIINVLFFIFDDPNEDDNRNNNDLLWDNISFESEDSSVSIGFTLADKGFTCLEIFDSTDQLLETLIEDTLESGYHEYRWNVSDQQDKSFYFRLQSDNPDLIDTLYQIEQ